MKLNIVWVLHPSNVQKRCPRIVKQERADWDSLRKQLKENVGIRIVH